jgi:hypothetical protein
MSGERWPRCRLADFDGYEPCAPFRTVVTSTFVGLGKPVCEVFESLPDALNHWVLHATPILPNGSAVVQDAYGTVLLGYNSHKTVRAGYAWWGIREAYELLAEHDLMNMGEVAVWEIQASGSMDDVLT